MGARPLLILMQLRITLHLSFIFSIAAILLAWNSVGAPKTARLEVDGSTIVRETRQVKVAGFLKEADITLDLGDVVEPSVGAALPNDQVLRITRAIPLTMVNDGASTEIRTAAFSVQDVLKEAGVTLGLYDVVTLAGKAVSPLASLRRKLSGTIATAGVPQEPAPVLDVRHTLPLYVHDRGFITEVHGVGATLQESLTTAGIGLKPGDESLPKLSTTAQAGQHVYLKRAKDARLWVDGNDRALRTLAVTVQDLLEEAGIRLNSGDRVEPAQTSILKEGDGITVIRVNEERVTVNETIPFSTEFVADSTIEIGEQYVAQVGARGLRKRQLHILYENGQEIHRTTEKEWIETAPVKALIHYGTKVVLRTIDTPSGPRQYWRKLRVYATWYTPGSSGKPLGAPGYGITSLGYEARRGIIAVDPTVIPYLTELFVPGYGVGIAADTGGGIRGSMIDLAYADDDEHDWGSGWTEVYFLGPGPDPSQIRPPIS